MRSEHVRYSWPTWGVVEIQMETHRGWYEDIDRIIWHYFVFRQFANVNLWTENTWNILEWFANPAIADPSHKRLPGSSLVFKASKRHGMFGCWIGVPIGVVQDFLQRGVMSMEEAKLCLLHAFSPQPFLDRNVPCSNLPELLWRSSLLTLTTLTLKEESWCRFLCDTHPLHRLSLRINTMQERK